MLGWCIVTLASARVKASVRIPPLRGMYQRGGTCKGCDNMGLPSVYGVRRCYCAAVEGDASLARLSGPYLSRFSTYSTALPVYATIPHDARGFIVLSEGFGRNAFVVVVVFAQYLHSRR